MGRYALLVGISNYNADLNPLPSAVKDVEALRQVLIDPEIGGFAESDVTVLKNSERILIETAIYQLFANRKTEDLLLFYFSGHGVTDSRGDFYLTGLSTRKDALPPTAISSTYIHDEMNKSRSKHQVLILDCCHSGAFSKGMTIKGSETVKVLPKLGGEGRAILTASDSSQYAFEQKGFELSLYTHFLVEGLKTGAADRDGDGDISVDELYEYVQDKVKSTNDCMSPEFYPVKEGHRIVLARAALDDPKLKFRKEVEKLVARNNGEVSTIAKHLLDQMSQNLAIIPIEAETIIGDVLLPYQEYEKKLKQYEQTLLEALKKRYPFSEVVQAELKDYERALGLREEDTQRLRSQLLPKPLDLKSFISRRNFLTLMSLAGVGFLSALIWERLKPQPTSYKIFKFETVKVDKTGAVIEFISAQVESLIYVLKDDITLEMLGIPAGKFLMGSNEDENEKPIHEVAIPAFFMGKYAITNTQWQSLMGKFPLSQIADPQKYKGFQDKNQPVVGVTWNEANTFCKKLSEKIKQNVRLPTEAEWEHACRSGTTTPFCYGETIRDNLVNYNGAYPYGQAPKGDNRGKTINVSSFSPNFFGMYQMHGNVWEWCVDEYHDNYSGKPEGLKINGSQAWANINDNRILEHILRGGCFANEATKCRSSSRGKGVPDYYDNGIGFRVVCTLSNTYG
ncbi:MAG: SUMF1/EgtB/PvdO family nonheme iron enzyme [Pseudanabaena sp. Salubria-1]|nr:SUMF1/EgtB/PvdO family nonheme iron enzyme [Pseudanabaena sp. Salubria-1]